MAEGAEKDQKTERATPKKRGDARQKGQVAKSQDLGAVVVLIGGVALLALMGSQIAMAMSDYLHQVLTGSVPGEFNTEGIVAILQHAAGQVLPLLGLFMACLVVLTAASTYAQIGFEITPEALKWDLTRISLTKGINNLFQWRSLVRVLATIVKASVILVSAYLAVRSQLPLISLLDRSQLPTITSFMGGFLVRAAMGACAGLVITAVADYAYQRWQFEKDMRMTKQEVRDESKQVEGDPSIKGQIRKKQREAAARRMMDAVPTATVVVTNPTHYAVALKYKTGESRAPLVVAKGADLVAQRIREIATEHNVPIVENKPLAQSLYRTAEIGSEIPATLYRAVAELLSYVYRLRGKL